jgi:hypothetical protein
MDLICYLRPTWAPTIRPANASRDWMDRTRLSFAYRCLPLNVANAHGWEILTSVACDAIWNGGQDMEDLQVRVAPGTDPMHTPVSIFGEGVLTFHVNAVFRTPPGWNLWVGGSPNSPKDGIFPLTGVIETDWSPYTFTMNWRFTRANHMVHFDAGEPICFLFPVQRTVLEQITPRFLPMESEAGLDGHYAAWHNSRQEWLERIKHERPVRPVDQWQKRYYRGIDMTDEEVVPDHLTKLRLAPFASVAQGAPPADPNAPIILDTDTRTLGRAIGEVAAALKSGALNSDASPDELAKRFTTLGLGESEALEVVWAALDRVKEDGT